MKNPHWTAAQEAQIALAERCATRATIYELGCAEYLKSHMPCADHVEEIRDVLASSVALRKRSSDIHEELRPSPRSHKPKTAPKVRSKQKD
jgi:DNA-binding NarL/FixJ family response regulator